MDTGDSPKEALMTVMAAATKQDTTRRSAQGGAPWTPTGARRSLAAQACVADAPTATRNRLVEDHLPLARTLARRYRRSSEPYEDLLQVASLALVKAADRFDATRGIDFRSFAIPTILGELKRHFRDATWAVHVPRSVQERARVVEAAGRQLTHDRGHSPTVQEIAVFLELSCEDVIDALQAGEAYGALSLDAPPRVSDGDGEDTSLGDTLGGIDERFDLVEADMAVSAALRALSREDRRLLRLRFVEELSQSEIAARLGVSQMQISRLLRRALDRVQVLADPA
jgi:RNA polymerase sigma-B factor